MNRLKHIGLPQRHYAASRTFEPAYSKEALIIWMAKRASFNFINIDCRYEDVLDACNFYGLISEAVYLDDIFKHWHCKISEHGMMLIDFHNL